METNDTIRCKGCRGLGFLAIGYSDLGNDALPSDTDDGECASCQGTGRMLCDRCLLLGKCAPAAIALDDWDGFCRPCWAIIKAEESTNTLDHDSHALPSLEGYSPQELRLLAEGILYRDGKTTAGARTPTDSEMMADFVRNNPGHAMELQAPVQYCRCCGKDGSILDGACGTCRGVGRTVGR